MAWESRLRYRQPLPQPFVQPDRTITQRGDPANAELDGQVAIVTGAGRGIGRATARLLAAAGVRVVVASRTSSELETLVGELTAAGQQAAAHPCDVSLAGSTRSLVDWTRERFGEPDILVCSHGVGAEHPFLELTERQWQETLATNLTGCFLVGQAVARAMVAAGRPGRIVFVSATNALAAEPHTSDYDASKAGLHGLTRSMALELGAHRITVNAVAPGWVSTPMTAPYLTDDLRAGRQIVNPLRRIGEPVDIASAIVWLAHPSSSYVNGSVVVVDGGQSAMLPLPWHVQSD
jgi:NAD(P)-dependent dehydrogenase (short-subunit alcohol dehydrogenase family)